MVKPMNEYARVRYAVLVVMGYAMEDKLLDGAHWGGATLRVVMKRHDVRHGVMPPVYEKNKPEVLLKQFKQHPVSKEYGYAEEGVDTGAEGDHCRTDAAYPDE